MWKKGFFVLLCIVSLSLGYGLYKKTALFDHPLALIRAKNLHKKTSKLKKCLSAKHVVKEEKPFVIVMRSYNNFDTCERALVSVFDQTYKNYRIIYIDDSSKDYTCDKVESIFKSKEKENKLTLIRNEKEAGPSANLYLASQLCKDNEIMVILNCDEMFTDRNVLTQINSCYANPEVWATYGTCVEASKLAKRYGKKFPYEEWFHKKTRDRSRIEFEAFRSFYAGLCKKVRMQDLFYKGRHLLSTDDKPCLFAISEMAAKHIAFLRDVLFFISAKTDQPQRVDFQTQSQKKEGYVFSLPRYKRLKHISDFIKNAENVDMVIASWDPLYLSSCLESIGTHVKGIKNVYVLYEAHEPRLKAAYQKIEEAFSQKETLFSFIENQDVKNFLNKKELSAYLFLGDDKIVFTADVDLRDSIILLENTDAKAFLFQPEEYLYEYPLMNLGKHLACQLSEKEDMSYFVKFSPLIMKTEEYASFLDVLQLPAHQSFKKFVLFSKNLSTTVLPEIRFASKITKEELLKTFEAGLKVAFSKQERLERPRFLMEDEVCFTSN